MKNIKYNIEFFSEWHCGSGLASGADKDSLVIKDKDKLPFVPGKTIKGLVREAIEDIFDFKGKDRALLSNMFGNSFDKNNIDNRSFEEQEPASKDLEKYVNKGVSFFTNAELSDSDKVEIIKAQYADYMYRTVTSTAIAETGVAEDNSLRRIETTVPCILQGEILDVPDNLYNDVVSALKYIKRLGQNRNRGLGRCCFSIKEGV